MREKCSDCRWWDEDAFNPATTESPCIAGPPVAVIKPHDITKDMVLQFCFPTTRGRQKACGHFAARETAKQETEVVGTGAFPGEAIAGNVAAKSPLAERGFRLIDKELWEKEIAPKPPKAKRWMVDARQTREGELHCSNCRRCFIRVMECGETGAKISPDIFKNKKRNPDCPAVEVECED